MSDDYNYMDTIPVDIASLWREHVRSLDAVHQKHRENAIAISQVSTRTDQIERRVGVIEEKMLEQRVMLTDVRALTHETHDAVTALKGAVNELRDSLSSVISIFQLHTTEDAERSARRTKSIQSLTRAVIILTTILGVGTVTLLALRAIILEEEMNISILGTLFGLSG